LKIKGFAFKRVEYMVVRLRIDLGSLSPSLYPFVRQDVLPKAVRTPDVLLDALQTPDVLLKALETIVTLAKYTLLLSSLVFLFLWVTAERHAQDEYKWDAAVFAVAGFGLQALSATLDGTRHRVKRAKGLRRQSNN
jgi:hypothetical protein